MRRTGLLLVVASLASGCGKASPGMTSPGLQPLLDPPQSGYQIVTGPFEVPPGTEQQICQTVKLPNEEPIAVNLFEEAHEAGTHHVILFRSDTPVEDQTFPCWGTVDFQQWQFVIDTQQQLHNTWELPDGVALIFPPHAQVMVQVHYQNATATQTPGQEGLSFINLHSVPMDQVKFQAGGMFTVNTNVHIPPHSPLTISRDCPLSQEVRVLAMTGHFHSRGRHFSVDHYSDDGVFIEHLYDSYDWNNAPFEIFPDQGVLLRENEMLHFTCEYMNNTDQEIDWGAMADTHEHCNLFVEYRPEGAGVTSATAPALTCTNGNSGW